jgi:TRAP-type mannitol/chloroaromatic compound transport system substrate-binding protein
MKRRNFLTAAAATGVAGAAGLAAPAIAQNVIEWNMVMPWPKQVPGVGVNGVRFAERVEALSGGRIRIKVYGAGELVPPFECLDAVQSGTADLAQGTPYYWVGKSKALNFFTGVPFGMTATERTAWLYYGDGMALWDEVYDQFGVKPFYAGSSGVQAGGWFRHEINSLEDLKGLKMRIAGLGGEVMRRVGVTPTMMPPGEIFPSLTSGAVDAAEWVGPWNDLAFGLYKVAKFYYTAAFHEPGPALEVFINKSKYEALPDDLKAIIAAAASSIANETTADFHYHNVLSLRPLVEDHGVKLGLFSDDIIRALGKATKEVMAEVAASDPLTGKVHDSFMAFRDRAAEYSRWMTAPSLNQRLTGLDA